MNSEDLNILPGQQEVSADGSITEVVTADETLPAEIRPIDEITAEIRFLKAKAGEAILEIGNRLIEAKAQLPHGKWEDWLACEVEFSKTTAERFMRLAKEYSKASPVTLLGASKALILLTLPPSEREVFAAEKHRVGDQEKTALEMTKRELEQAVKAKLEAERDAFGYQERITKLEAELEALRSAPKEVTAVETVPDREREQALKKEIASLEIKLEKAKAGEKAARSDLAAARKEAEAAREKEAAAVETGKKTAENLNTRIEKLQKQMKSDTALYRVRFKVYYEQIDSVISKMLSEIAQLQIEGAEEDRAKLKAAAVKIFAEAQRLFEES